MTTTYCVAEAELQELIKPTGVSVRIEPMRSSVKYYMDFATHKIKDMSLYNGKLIFSFHPTHDTILSFSIYYPPIYYTKYIETITIATDCYGKRHLETIQNRLRKDSHSDMVLTSEQTRIVEKWYEKNAQRWYEATV